MAKAKSKNLRGAGSPDFTFNEPMQICIRFNAENVLIMGVNRDLDTISGRLFDEVNGKTYLVSGTLTEES